MAKLGRAKRKLGPYKYPTKKHKRAQIPESQADYRSYKPTLKNEFDSKCVYCRKLDFGQDPGAFHVEHYRPKSEFPELISEYSNLFYACASCNRYKRAYWNEHMKLPNPCDDVMSEHVTFAMETIDPRSTRGEFMAELLRLNSPRSLEFRRYQIDIVSQLIERVFELRGDRTKAAEVQQAIQLVAKTTGFDEVYVSKVLR